MYWQPELETLSRDALHAYQLERLRDTVAQAMRSPYYGKLYSEAGISPESLKSIDDLHKLPFTTKEDLRGCYPYGFLAVDQKEVVRLHCSSGTTGNPTVIFHSEHDLKSWANLVARSLYATGARDTDVFQNICGYGLFTGGLGFQYGAECLGALTIPSAAGNSRRQIKLMQDFSTTVVHAIPSYLTRLHDVFLELGLEPEKDTDLRVLVIGAEPHSEETRQRIEEMFGAKAFNSYGLSEMNGPGVAFECEHQTGLHVWEDCFLTEIVNPETLEPVGEGEIGELVFTTLDRQAMPIIRYRTRDLTQFLPGDCPCGRTHRRVGRIVGRSDDMFIVRGCNIFPTQIEKVLMGLEGVGNDYVIVVENVDDNDQLTIKVEVSRDWFDGEYSRLEALAKTIMAQVRDEVLVTPRVKLLEPGALPKAEGKAVRVQDLRGKKAEG